MNIFDVVTPVLVIVGAIVGVAVLYLGFTAIKDRRASKSDRNDRL